MVIFRPPNEGHAPRKRRSTLQRVLKRANYATNDLQAAEGPDYQEEVVIIRLIEADTISSKNYPRSIWRRQSADPEALALWENEGGAPARPADDSNPKENRNDLA
ncbi:hypothetical protein [Rhizobium binxianense]